MLQTDGDIFAVSLVIEFDNGRMRLGNLIRTDFSLLFRFLVFDFFINTKQDDLLILGNSLDIISWRRRIKI